MTTYPLATLGPTITSAGITSPAFSDIYVSLQASYQSIYGEDTYIEPDSQDGQWIGVLAQGYYDVNQACIAVYNAYSPSYAQGTALSSLVKLNDIQRHVPTNSTWDVSLVGVAGTTITNGVVTDPAGNQWLLPVSVIIPTSGSITVTATASSQGSLSGNAGVTMTISTPTRGWQSATSTDQATAGNPVEDDYDLRIRRTKSTAQSAQTIVEGIDGALANLTGVTRLEIYDNDNGQYDGSGIPSGAVSIVIEGGDDQEIADTIAVKKTPGVPTYGTTSVITVDSRGVPNMIKFFRPTVSQVSVKVDITPLTGYTSTIGSNIQTAIYNAINALGIGGDQGYLYRTPLIATAYGATGASGTCVITDIKLAYVPDTPIDQDLDVAFNVIPEVTTDNIVLNVA